MASSNVKIIPFCVPLPSSSSLSDPNNANSAGSTATDSGFGIVGTITLRGQSAVVWFGWGAIDSIKEDDINVDDDNGSGRRMDGVVSVGHGKPPMGSLALSMPPLIRNNGRKILNNELPTSQLLGGSSEEDMILGHQISSRLAKRIGWPIFVSCSFSGWGGDSFSSSFGNSAGQGGGSGGGGGQEGGNVIDSPALSAGYDDSMQQHAAALAEREVGRILMSEKSEISARK